MEAVQNEVINNLRATFKETDLFKVYQVPQATARPISQTVRQISNDCILTLHAALRPLSKVLLRVLQVVPAAPCSALRSSLPRQQCAAHRPCALIAQDIGSLETSAPEVAAKCPSLLKLRDQLYSAKFRALMEQLTGCGTFRQPTR
jgi:hypothetical protein